MLLSVSRDKKRKSPPVWAYTCFLCDYELCHECALRRNKEEKEQARF